MKTTKSNNRRNFLLAAGLGGAGVAAAVATGAKAPVARGKVAAADDKSGGYQASEHVLKYYETTKV